MNTAQFSHVVGLGRTRVGVGLGASRFWAVRVTWRSGVLRLWRKGFGSIRGGLPDQGFRGFGGFGVLKVLSVQGFDFIVVSVLDSKCISGSLVVGFRVVGWLWSLLVSRVLEYRAFHGFKVY